MPWTVPTEAVSHCPSCGSAVAPDPQEVDRSPLQCPDCDQRLFRNPVPMARATIVDGERALLIERGRGADVGSWALAGGYLEHDEAPRVGAARELEEETGLSVSPADLVLIGEGFLEFEEYGTMVSFNYAASRDAATGTVRAGDDATDARFWSREELQTDPPLLRASGLDQVLAAMDSLG